MAIGYLIFIKCQALCGQNLLTLGLIRLYERVKNGSITSIHIDSDVGGVLERQVLPETTTLLRAVSELLPVWIAPTEFQFDAGGAEVSNE